MTVLHDLDVRHRRRTNKPSLIRRVGVYAASLSLVGVLVACVDEPTPEAEDHPGWISTVADGEQELNYQSSSPLTTTNAGSITGSSTAAQQLSARLYPGVYVPGPHGQLIQNSDLISVRFLPGIDPQVIYTISEDAQYSDGAPITCTDFLLAYTAGVMPELFASQLPLMQHIDEFECQPGAARFSVRFQEGAGKRWRELFSPGTVLPAHAIASRAGMSLTELHQALEDRDVEKLSEPARIWSEAFALDNFDSLLQVSAGPFLLDHVSDDGAAILVRNEAYYGDDARLASLAVWPARADSGKLLEQDSLDIADISQVNPEWLDRNAAGANFTIQPQVGELTDALLLSETGVFAEAGSRQAFAACIDQAAVAETSSRVSGVEVGPVLWQSIEHEDPVRHHLQDISESHVGVDIAKARELEGQTIRVGYRGQDKRLAAMVEIIAKRCREAGIEVVDAAQAETTAQDLYIDDVNTAVGGSVVEDSEEEATKQSEGDQPGESRKIDAYLGAVYPPNLDARAAVHISGIDALRRAESMMWEEVSTIPLAAQPRVFVINRDVTSAVPYTGESAIGWNMDRWQKTR